ncbi:MAG TPA: cupin domain-containing protein [Vitreimonas sp.]|nr:cupin domain-containing protein [Vitreimonas sp.]
MKIIPKQAAIHVDKVEGSSVDYYIFPEYELHYNEIKPGTVQQWHHHRQISETLYVMAGEIEAHWVDEAGQKHMRVMSVGDVVEVENTPHTFINSSSEVVKFIVFRFVPTGEDKRELIKNDKVIDTSLE